RAAPRHAGDDRRSRHAARGARARRGHDHLRAHLRDQHLPDARTAGDHRLMSEHAERRAALQRERAAALAERLEQWLRLEGDERALDVGAGAGAFAFAIAPRVREVVAVEIDEALAERARADAPANVEVVVADGEHLPFERASFDVAGTLRTLHHT